MMKLAQPFPRAGVAATGDCRSPLSRPRDARRYFGKDILLLLCLGIGLAALGSGTTLAQTGASTDGLRRLGNVIDAGPASGVITLANPTAEVPVRITRDDPSPVVMAFSVIFTVSSDLDLPSGTASITEGDYLRSGGGLTTFLTVDLGGGRYKADGATLGQPCGTTAGTGTLFTVEVTSSATAGVGTVTIQSVTLRDCSNQDVAATIGTAGEVTIDRSAPLVTVTSPNGGEIWHIGSPQTITWMATDPEGIASIDVAYSMTGGAPYTAIASGLPGTQNSYPWTIPATPSTTVKILVSAHDVHGNFGEDASDADFTIAYYRIQATAAPNGTIDPTGVIELPYGGSQGFSILPDPCYHVADVLVDGESIGPVTNYEFTDVQDDHTIRAFFAIDVFTITATAALHGSISPSGAVPVECGADQGFSIASDLGYHVIDVLVDGSSVGAAPTYTFTNVTANHTIHATFAINVLTITATAGPHGAIDPSGAVIVEYGADQAFSIAPDPGYHVADVLVDGGSVGPATSYTFTNVTTDHTIHATFAIDVFTITATAGPNGAIDPAGAVPVEYGADQSFAIAADPGCHTLDVLVDGSSVGPVPEYTFTNVTADHTIAASFEVNPPVAPIVDLVATQIRTGNDPGETTRIRLTWTATPSGTIVEVWRAAYGHYPEYDDGGGSAPTFSPTYPPGAGWSLTGITATGETEMPGPRDVYHYVAYVKDGYGTWSPASNGTGGTLNYHLGDVSDGANPGTGDNRVFGEDVSLLGSHYGIALALDDPLNYLDVGPTTTMFIDGRPTTDDRIDFEDLVMFAINYDIVSLAKGTPAAQAASADELVLLAPERVGSDGTVTVTLNARGTGELIALSVKLGWNPAVVEPAGFAPGDWLTGQAGIALSARAGTVDAAVLNGRGLTGEGILASFTFKVLAAGETGFRVDSVEGRSHRNRRIGIPVSVRATAPIVTQLESTRPNPVRGATAIAFSLAAAGPAELSIFSVDGRKVRTLSNGARDAGRYSVSWDGSDDGGTRVAEGVYYAQLVTAQGRQTRKIVLLR